MSDSFLTKTERHARWIDSLKKIAGGLLFGGGLAVSILVLALRPTWKMDIAQAEARSIITSNQQSDAIRQLTERVIRLETRMEDKEIEDDRRWNGLDRVLQKQFGQSILAVPPPSYGPAAKQQGLQ